MSITVKRLIAELEKIENKLLEVEIYVSADHQGFCEIGNISLPKLGRKKIVLFTKQEVK